MAMEWTDEQRRTLMDGYKAGKTSRQIAQELGPGFTVNSVLSQIYHLKHRISDETYRKAVHPNQDIWSMEEHERRSAITIRAAKGAREQLAQSRW